MSSLVAAKFAPKSLSGASVSERLAFQNHFHSWRSIVGNFQKLSIKRLAKHVEDGVHATDDGDADADNSSVRQLGRSLAQL